jgi:hypothetical protein
MKLKTIIVSNLLKFELLQFFFEQTVADFQKNILIVLTALPLELKSK